MTEVETEQNKKWLHSKCVIVKLKAWDLIYTSVIVEVKLKTSPHASVLN